MVNAISLCVEQSDPEHTGNKAYSTNGATDPYFQKSQNLILDFAQKQDACNRPKTILSQVVNSYSLDTFLSTVAGVPGYYQMEG